MDFLIDNYYVLAGGVALLVIFLALYLPWKRRKDLHALAASQGLNFSERGPEVSNFGHDLFCGGRSKSSENRIQFHTSDYTIDFFDYSYVTGSGRSRSTHRFTVALIQVFKVQVPDFDLKPENFLHKLGELVGFKDIDLPAFPLFSEKYRLTAPDEAAVHMFFTPRRAAWFEQNHGLRVQGAPGALLFIKKQGLLPVGDWPAFMEEVKSFAVSLLR